MSLKVVLFPVPDPPMIPTASPLLMVMLTPFRIFLLPKDLCTSFSSIKTSSCCRWCRGFEAAEEPNLGLGIVLTSPEAVVACIMITHPILCTRAIQRRVLEMQLSLEQKALLWKGSPSWPQDAWQGEDAAA